MQNPRAQWASCQNYFKQNIEASEYEKWFSKVEFESFTPATCTLVLSVPSDYVCQYIEKNYIDHLRVAISNTFGRIRLNWHTIIVKKEDSNANNTSAPQTKRGGKGFGYTVEGAVDTETPDGLAKAALASNKTEALIQAPGSVVTTHLPEIDSQLNLHQTFSNYVEGASNKLCRSVGLSIAEHPQGTQFNPMFIYGPSGCGKTHLVNAIGVRCKEMYPNKRVLYVSARIFQVQYTNANMQGKINDFIGFYQTIDMLIVDDVQEWLTSTKTQETFFQAIRSIDRFDGSCKVSTWLCAIARNVLLAYRRKNPTAEELPDSIGSRPSSEEEVLGEMNRLDLIRLIHRLPEPSREVVYLRVFGDLSFANIGEIHGKSENWARVTFFRAKEKLRKDVEQ